MFYVTMSTPLLLRTAPLLLRFTLLKNSSRSLFLRPYNTTESQNDTGLAKARVLLSSSSKEPSAPTNYSSRWEDEPHFRKWKKKESEILKDIESITYRTKNILHSERYMDGERLTPEDEKAVLEKLLAYHPHSEDKIGCGLDFIMVDRHPQFKHSRCLFVVRTDGGWIDFSYQKCIRAYIRDKYPSYAERFIRGHFKRSSS